MRTIAATAVDALYSSAANRVATRKENRCERAVSLWRSKILATKLAMLNDAQAATPTPSGGAEIAKLQAEADESVGAFLGKS
jgi:hypothetical protein